MLRTAACQLHNQVHWTGKKTPEGETLTEPRKSSKWSLFGSEGRMRISCVILQRRLPRRSLSEEGCLGNCLLGVFRHQIVLGPPGVNHLSGKLPRAIREECNPVQQVNL